MRVVSWNVNGLRACAGKGFLDILENMAAEVLCLQEVRAFPDQLPAVVREPVGWHTAFAPAERPGYSGVAIYARQAPRHVDIGLGVPEFDTEGRFILARFDTVQVASVYFPKGSGKERDNSRVPYKLAFYDAVFARIEKARAESPVLVLGDYNTAHHAIDLARPKTNARSSGFLPEERAVLDHWEAAGWVDTFRAHHPDAPDHYTWWRQWGNARAQNVGWRIDYVFACPQAAARVRDAFIWPEITGSDHCPVGVDLD
ncbi:MAG TPA: exodeoxyribonuclease III [Gammaproteobacteria bacterium]|nr:exodeoxyribonuclease III [Gammaproteobacteria bacterium]